MTAGRIDARDSVSPSGGHWSGQAVAVAGQGGEQYGVPRPSTLECRFCEYRAEPEALKVHIGLMHRERVLAARAYEEALAQGAALDAARARYNAIVRAAIEGGPGRYLRVQQAEPHGV